MIFKRMCLQSAPMPSLRKIWILRVRYLRDVDILKICGTPILSSRFQGSRFKVRELLTLNRKPDNLSSYLT